MTRGIFVDIVEVGRDALLVVECWGHTSADCEIHRLGIQWRGLAPNGNLCGQRQLHTSVGSRFVAWRGWQVGPWSMWCQSGPSKWTYVGSTFLTTSKAIPQIVDMVGARVASSDGPKWATTILATWIASGCLLLAIVWLFCPCKHNSPSTHGTKWNLNIKCCFLNDFIHFSTLCWWQKKVFVDGS